MSKGREESAEEARTRGLDPTETSGLQTSACALRTTGARGNFQAEQQHERIHAPKDYSGDSDEKRLEREQGRQRWISLGLLEQSLVSQW